MVPTELERPDGVTLSCHAAKPANGVVRASVIMVHGLGDHSRALPYRDLSAFLVSHGVAVYGFDLRGHGQSSGDRVYVNAWREFRDDLRAFSELVKRDSPDQPLFLVGLSMGGLLVLNYAQHFPDRLNGVIAAAPALDASGSSPLLRFLLPVLALLIPKVALDPGLDLTRLSRDANAVQTYTTDPYWQTKMTPRLAVEIVGAIEETRANAPRMSVPILILHGSADTIVPPQGSATFFELVGSTDKARRVYQGAYHALYIDTNRGQVFGDILEWIEARL